MACPIDSLFRSSPVPNKHKSKSAGELDEDGETKGEMGGWSERVC